MSSILNFRTLIAVVFTVVFLILFRYYNESVDTVISLEREKEKCQQSLDTISAQLQVVYEHKSRLEKSLQQEKDNLLKYKIDQTTTLADLRQKLQVYKKNLETLRVDYDSLQMKYVEMQREKDEIKAKAEQAAAMTNERSLDVETKFSLMKNQLDLLKVENAYLKSFRSFQNVSHQAIFSMDESNKIYSRNNQSLFAESKVAIHQLGSATEPANIGNNSYFIKGRILGIVPKEEGNLNALPAPDMDALHLNENEEMGENLGAIENKAPMNDFNDVEKNEDDDDIP